MNATGGPKSASRDRALEIQGSRAWHSIDHLDSMPVQTAWRLYWDKQLLKVLDAQFARDLQSLLANLPPQHVRLVFAEQAVQFEPPLDDIRASFYREHLDSFLSIPCQVCCSKCSALNLQGWLLFQKLTCAFVGWFVCMHEVMCSCMQCPPPCKLWAQTWSSMWSQCRCVGSHRHMK